jgi:hypothetical protein
MFINKTTGISSAQPGIMAPTKRNSAEEII